MPARDAATARQARKGQPVQDERIDREQHDQRQLGLELGVGEVVGAIEHALPDDGCAGGIEDEERDDDDAGDEPFGGAIRVRSCASLESRRKSVATIAPSAIEAASRCAKTSSRESIPPTLPQPRDPGR